VLLSSNLLQAVKSNFTNQMEQQFKRRIGELSIISLNRPFVDDKVVDDLSLSLISD
jgi:hypothetical protein